MPDIDGEEQTQKLLASPLWQNLPAVRDGTVYVIDYVIDDYTYFLNVGILANEAAIDNVLALLSDTAITAKEETSR